MSTTPDPGRERGVPSGAGLGGATTPPRNVAARGGEPDARSEPDTRPEPDARPEPEPETRSEPESDARSEPDTRPEPDARPEPEPETRSEPDVVAADNRYVRRDEGDRRLEEDERPTGRRAVVDRERDKFGGARVGTGFFGWVAATGLAVLMTALTDAIGTAFGAHPATSIPSVTRATGEAARTIGWGGTIVLLIIMFLAYLGGGYVAGRMARFHGIRQGLLVWLWGLVVAVVIAAIAHFAGTQYDILGLLNDFPRIPIGVGVTTWGAIALIVVALAGLLGALLGGLWGMSFHRRVDRAGLGR